GGGCTRASEEHDEGNAPHRRNELLTGEHHSTDGGGSIAVAITICNDSSGWAHPGGAGGCPPFSDRRTGSASARRRARRDGSISLLDATSSMRSSVARAAARSSGSRATEPTSSATANNPSMTSG